MDRSKRTAGTVAGLPDDPLVEILSRVPAKSVCRFRCVSKAWRDLIDDPLNHRKLPQTLEGFFVIDDWICSDDGGDVEHFINFRARSVPLDIDGRFSFLTKLPEIEILVYEDSCNGLLLFEHYRKQHQDDILSGYIVCNPATKHWGTVPLNGCCQTSTAQLQREIFVAFDPAVSSHFHLILFWRRPWDEEGTFENPLILVHAYSSETGMWSHLDEQEYLEGLRHQVRLAHVSVQRAFVNGILHLIVLEFGLAPKMVVVDVRGKTKMIITMPAVAYGRRRYIRPYYIGQSQGRVYYINCDFDAHDSINMQSYMSVWVLQDYDTQEWVLKDTVGFLRLFGIMTASMRDFVIVAIHPDCNVVFFLHPFNRLIAYDMDRKEVSVVACFKDKWYIKTVPYIPYFSESPALTDKH